MSLIFICFDFSLFNSNLRRNHFIELSKELGAPILDRGQKNFQFGHFSIWSFKFLDRRLVSFRCIPVYYLPLCIFYHDGSSPTSEAINRGRSPAEAAKRIYYGQTPWPLKKKGGNWSSVGHLIRFSEDLIGGRNFVDWYHIVDWVIRYLKVETGVSYHIYIKWSVKG